MGCRNLGVFGGVVAVGTVAYLLALNWNWFGSNSDDSADNSCDDLSCYETYCTEKEVVDMIEVPVSNNDQQEPNIDTTDHPVEPIESSEFDCSDVH